MKPDRVVIGQRTRGLKTDAGNSCAVHADRRARDGDRTAERRADQTANAMLARISFMNEVANVCELVGADVDQVRRAIGADRRIGTSFSFLESVRRAVFRRTSGAGASPRKRTTVQDAARRRIGERLAENAAALEDARTSAASERPWRCGASRSNRGPTTCGSAVDCAHRGSPGRRRRQPPTTPKRRGSRRGSSLRVTFAAGNYERSRTPTPRYRDGVERVPAPILPRCGS